jgi:hypothetical protein
VDGAEARAVVRAAEQSFAEWPSPRELTFRDVAHYLCFESLCRSRKNRKWTAEVLSEVVDSEIPVGL